MTPSPTNIFTLPHNQPQSANPTPAKWSSQNFHTHSLISPLPLRYFRTSIPDPEQPSPLSHNTDLLHPPPTSTLTPPPPL
ncbi:hypothetical protein Pmani_038213 [Petrolisthes manimaculis]|uniref:Uncharacterized protein n=1 Tax=Petrolisthes manimaculis TaxID=1843537 RepID=A0AAE1TKL9_9EUCA|nr:hypothetical protein Pmani_038213 [Petrolisthes manimaculis]